MAIENYPVWTFEPNWSGSVSEMLEWLTDVLTAPDGSEQRRSLRFFPRRSFEFAIAEGGPGRQLLDNMLISFGAARWYVPLWHEVNILDLQAVSGASALASAELRDRTGVRVGSVLCLMGDDPYTYELVEVQALTADGVTLETPLIRTWPMGTRVFHVCSAELTDQPQLTPRNGNLVSAEVRFRVMDVEEGTAPLLSATLPEVYRGFSVMTLEPDSSERQNIDYERIFSTIDNQTSVPQRRDVAGRPFTAREYGWLLEGREAHADFASMLQALRGRAIPLWVSTQMDDFIPLTPLVMGQSAFDVGRCGFTAAGGPRWDRQDIMITLVDGQNIYRRITASSEIAGGDRLQVDTPFTATHSVTEILRVSFITLMRLNHDVIEIDHSTDTHGVSRVKATFRSAPDTRVPLLAFDE